MDPSKKPSDPAENTSEHSAKLSRKQLRKNAAKKAHKEDEIAMSAISADTRFRRLFEDPKFARDPTSNKYDTKDSTNAIIVAEKERRRNSSQNKPEEKKLEDDNLAQMVARIKAKTKAMQEKKI